MANIISQEELMFYNFEPRTKNRFIMYIEGIPAFEIKTTDFPKVSSEVNTLDHINVKRYTKGKSEWAPINITLFDPIAPPGVQAVMEWFRLSHESVTGRNGYADFYKKDVTIFILGPAGEKVGKWVLQGAWPTDIDFGSGDWSDASPVNISCTLRMDLCILQY